MRPDFAECMGRTFRYGMPAALFIILPGACAVQVWVWLTGYFVTGESLGEVTVFIFVTITWMIAVRYFGWQKYICGQWARMFS